MGSALDERPDSYWNQKRNEEARARGEQPVDRSAIYDPSRVQDRSNGIETVIGAMLDRIQSGFNQAIGMPPQEQFRRSIAPKRQPQFGDTAFQSGPSGTSEDTWRATFGPKPGGVIPFDAVQTRRQWQEDSGGRIDERENMPRPRGSEVFRAGYGSPLPASTMGGKSDMILQPAAPNVDKYREGYKDPNSTVGKPLSELEKLRMVRAGILRPAGRDRLELSR